MKAMTLPDRSPAPWPAAPTPATLTARRADWRFLLPDPVLGRVAYPAPRDPRLFEALQQVSRSVERASTTELEGFDVIVVTGSRAALAEVVGRAPSGSWVVAEVPGRVAAGTVRRLRSAGCVEVEAHWPWPDLQSCREIVPLRPAALRLALSRRDPGARLRVRVRVASLVARTPLFSLMVDRVVVVARIAR
jgi:hypothetical protein